LVRHGQASFGTANYDVLSSLGHRQAEVLAGVLTRERRRISCVVAGSLARQQATAAPIAAALGRPVEADSRWNEYDADDILAHHSTTAARLDRPAGSDMPSVSAQEFQILLEAALLAWIAAGESGPTDESWPAFAARARAAFGAVLGGIGPGETAVVCTSGGVISALCVELLAVPAATFVHFNRVTVNTGITRVAIGRSGSTLVSFNDQGHLQDPAGELLTYR
jgi:broad specificity phosphatase PhoE